MSYEEKYKKYKKMYLQLKLKYGQHGGDNNDDDNSVYGIAQKTKKWLIEKFGDKFEGIKNYDKVIPNLKKHCQTNITNFKDAKYKLKDIYNMFQNNELLGEFNDYLTVDKQQFNLPENNWNNAHEKMCEYFLKILQREQELQQKLIEKLNNLKIDGKIDISKYIDFAREKHMLDDSIDNIDNIIQKYTENINNLASEIDKEKKKNDAIILHLQEQEQKLTNLPTVNTFGIQTSNIGKSKNEKHPCIGPCETRYDMIRGHYDACTTKPYDYMFNKYDWDFCEK